jgi:hypothetical protein
MTPKIYISNYNPKTYVFINTCLFPQGRELPPNATTVICELEKEENKVRVYSPSKNIWEQKPV